MLIRMGEAMALSPDQAAQELDRTVKGARHFVPHALNRAAGRTVGVGAYGEGAA